jgi:hypothetical protein
MIVVVAIVGVLLVAIVPAASRLWTQRNEAAAINTLRGLLISVRAQAIRTGPRGLLFYTDRGNTQRVVFIEADPPGSPQDKDDCDAFNDDKLCTPSPVAVVATVDRFRVVPGQVYTLTAPYRVAPGWTVAADSQGNPLYPFDLERDTFGEFITAASGTDTPRYHRNFFTVVFDVDGQLDTGRNVLVHDADRDDDSFGDATGLPVEPETDFFWRLQNGAPVQASLAAPLFDMVRLFDGAAANFISNAALIVYDESDVTGLTGSDIGVVLTREGQPFYVNRYTGEVIVGPPSEGLGG